MNVHFKVLVIYLKMFLFIIGCNGGTIDLTQNKSETPLDTLVEIDNSTNNEHLIDTVGSLIGQQIFKIPIREYLSSGNQKPLSFDNSKLEFLVPISFVAKDDKFYLPNKFGETIDIYNNEGKIIDQVSFEMHGIDLVDFSLYNDTLYIVSNRDGLYIIDSNNILVKQVPNITKIFTPHNSDNIYFYGWSDEKNVSIVLDKNNKITKTMQGQFFDAFSTDTLLYILNWPQNSNNDVFEIEEFILPEINRMNKRLYKLDCKDCFVLPELIDKNLIISSNPTLNQDQILLLEDSIIKQFVLNYPNSFPMNTVVSIEHAGYAYFGLTYSFDKKNNILYAMGTDMEYVRIFSFDLNVIK